MFPKWKYFLWRILHRALPTSQNLRKRGRNEGEECLVCHEGEDTQSHIFRFCKVAQWVWKDRSLVIISTTPENVNMEDLLMNFLSYFFKQHGRNEGRLVQFTAILWSLWLHRNDITFRGVSGTPESILDVAQTHVHG